MRKARLLVAAAMALSACARSVPVSTSAGLDARISDGVSQLRSATKAFQSLDSAVAVGYPKEVAACIVHAHHGAMGFHHTNRAYVDSILDVKRPEILLYEKRPDGKYRLNGVEFILPYRFYSRDSVPPVLLGQKLQQEDNLKYWFLHVWAWTDNASGIFSDFNKAVGCPAGTARLYKPSSEP
jgi:hypothetical protein